MKYTVVLVLFFALVIPARAAELLTVGCAAQGYTMQVPGDWTVHNQCSSSMQVKNVASDLQMIVRVEHHGFWSDARSRSSIKGDVASALAAVSATQGSAIIFRINTIHGHRYFAGLVQLNFTDGTNAYMIEQETFYAGYMSKFTAFTHVDDSAVRLAGMVWGTIRLTRHP